MMRIHITFYRWLFASVVGFSLIVAGSACGGDGKDIGQQSDGRITVRPPSLTFSKIPPGQTETKKLEIENTGDGELRIFSLTLKEKKGSSIDALSVVKSPGDKFSIKAEETKTIEVEYAPKSRGTNNSGVIEIRSSDPTFDEGERLEVDVLTLGNRPQLHVSPSQVRFPKLPPGKSMTREVTLQNIGSSELTVYEKPEISGSQFFRVKDPGRSFPVTLQPIGQTNAGETNSELVLEVDYAPRDTGSDSAKMIVKTNEKAGSTKDNPTEKEVDVAANADTPCIILDGKTRNIGSVPVGGSATEVITAENCGSKPLVIRNVALVKNSKGDEFSLALNKEQDPNGDGKLDDPVTLEKTGDTENFLVRYQPDNAGFDEGMVVVESNDPVQQRAEIALRAKGAEGTCPSAKVTAKVKGVSAAPRARITAAPLDYVVLDGGHSTDEDGRIVEYDWRIIEKPEDVNVRLGPVSESSKQKDESRREFRLLTAGTYKVGLQVKDNDGFVSCNEAVATISAVPNEKVHVELTWTNPEDPDEDDDRGSDVDLHLAKMGPGKWFDAPFDIYFRNPNNENNNATTGIWQPENPSLDIDDTDGAGPENIQMDDPQACQWYSVGVHYYKQLFGTAYVTVRIYINAKLVYEKLNKPLKRGGQFWDVARIHWPTGQVYDHDKLDAAPPVDEKPVVTEAMKSSGLCTAEKLY